MNKDEIDRMVARYRRLSEVCTTAKEAFEPNSQPWRWLHDTAKCYADAAELFGRDGIANTFVGAEKG